MNKFIIIFYIVQGDFQVKLNLRFYIFLKQKYLI